jgi:Ni/Co efflux regulator RcnB
VAGLHPPQPEEIFMKRNIGIAATLIAGILAASGGALADKPGGKPDKNDREERQEARNDDHRGGKPAKKDKEARHDDRRGAAPASRFDDGARNAIFEYYGAQARAGKCPPGLAKKQNGCQPPGQAKKWKLGQPLPPDLRYGSLPPELLRRLPPPPPQHRYVQIAGDVLMIAVGTSMVVDAVEDILR